ncbi:MAG: hypothetical protein BAA02_05075 [Paenibacillaceae bacterium ZCTH02-B3]|nr:MAG: hypothetical protein BAA02_05075 [Paenibacillaceae bacterium ZCTH02-B3]
MTMRLADLLGNADIAQLARIAKSYGCQCDSHSKNDLIQSILYAAQGREAFEPHLDGLNEAEWRFLHSLLFENRTAYSPEELAARAEAAANPSPALLTKPEVSLPVKAVSGSAKGLASGPAAGSSAGTAATCSARTRAGSPAVPPGGKTGKASGRRKRKKAAPDAEADTAPADPHGAIGRFRSFGWLFGGMTRQTSHLYHMPEDVRQRLCDALERRFRARLERRGQPPVYRDERGLLAEDIVVFLRFVRDRDIPLTADGVLYKRQLQQVLALMSVPEAPPDGSGWRFGYGRRFREYPDRFALIYDFCFYRRLVEERPDRLVLTEAGYAAAGGEAPPDPADVYRFWLRLYKGPVANLHPVVQWIARLAGDWVTETSLEEVLLPLLRPFCYDSERDVFRLRVLRMMTHLGLLQRGETETGEPVVRATPQGRELITGSRVMFEDLIVFP